MCSFGITNGFLPTTIRKIGRSLCQFPSCYLQKQSLAAQQPIWFMLLLRTEGYKVCLERVAVLVQCPGKFAVPSSFGLS